MQLYGQQKKGQYIQKNINEIAVKVMDRQFEKVPSLHNNLSEKQKDKFLEDVSSNLSHLAISLKVNKGEIYLKYMEWLGVLMSNMKFSLEGMLLHFQCTYEVLNEILQDRNSVQMHDLLKQGQKTFTKSYLRESNDNLKPLKGEIAVFITHILNDELDKARFFIEKSMEKGNDIQYIYMNLIQPSLYEIGELWYQRKLSVSKEHYLTAFLNDIMTSLYPRYVEKHTKGTMLALCPGKEFHQIGMRMVTDFFQLDGWKTHYIGGNISNDHIMEELNQREVDIVAISSTITTNIDTVKDLINGIKNHEKFASVKIIVGGKTFNDHKDLWMEFGADAYGSNPQEAINWANKQLL